MGGRDDSRVLVDVGLAVWVLSLGFVGLRMWAGREYIRQPVPLG